MRLPNFSEFKKEEQNLLGIVHNTPEQDLYSKEFLKLLNGLEL